MYVARKDYHIENVHVLSCSVLLKSVLLISCVFWIFFQNASSQLCFRFFFRQVLSFRIIFVLRKSRRPTRSLPFVIIPAALARMSLYPTPSLSLSLSLFLCLSLCMCLSLSLDLNPYLCQSLSADLSLSVSHFLCISLSGAPPSVVVSITVPGSELVKVSVSGICEYL